MKLPAIIHWRKISQYFQLQNIPANMNSKFLCLIICSIFFSNNYLYARNPDKKSTAYTSYQEETTYVPLYAGTMLAFFPENVDSGQLVIQSYLFRTVRTGSYDKNWTFKSHKTINALSLLLLIETGITKYLDISFLFNPSYTSVGHRHSFLYADTQVLLGLQISHDQKGSWIPDFRIVLGESFPTGKYQHLDPQKILSDSSGSGTYETSLIVVCRKIFYISTQHPFNLNLNLAYTISTSTNIKGVSVYGGAPHTQGKAKPGDEFLVDLAIEYSLTRNWVLGTDIQYIHQNKSPVSGKQANFPIDSWGLPSSEQLSLAPCLEYNYTENFGILGGAWFTIAGRNSGSFLSGIVSVFYEF